MAVDRGPGCAGRSSQYPGAAMVDDTDPSSGCIDDVGASGTVRAFVNRWCPRHGDQQPPDPPGRRGVVGGRAAGAPHSCPACRAHLDVAARRFSVLALWCYGAIAASGITNAALRITPDELLTPYGLLLLAKVSALGLLGVLGWRQRRIGVAALNVDPSERRPLVRLALTEAAIVAVTVGIAVGLGRTPPPPTTAEPTPAEMAIGFDLRSAHRNPDTARLALRPDTGNPGFRTGRPVCRWALPIAP